MTPLAHAIATELTLPRARRTFDDQANVLSHITEAVCFEVTEVVQMARIRHDSIMLWRRR